MKKKVFIIDHNEGGRLANQLWPYISVYAYCLEKKYEIENFSFFQYAEYFQNKTSNIIALFINKIFYFLKKITRPKYHGQLLRRYRVIYKTIIKLIFSFCKIRIEAPDLPNVKPRIIYLPPTKNYDKRFELFEKDKSKILLLNGWLFRNPEGLKRYHCEIINYFKPKKDIAEKVDNFINNIRRNYKKIVGVHIRQGDYKNKFLNGRYYFNEKEVNVILNEYLKLASEEKSKIFFIVCSDEDVDLKYFPDLNIGKSIFKNPVEDLYLLATTDLIIGSNNTFGTLASYFGNIPFIVFQRERIDWEYYKNKNEYFENKYSTFVWY